MCQNEADKEGQNGKTKCEHQTQGQRCLTLEHDGLAVAILDHVRRDGYSTRLCETLSDRGIPFVIYSGFNKIEAAYKAGPLVGKPPPEMRLWQRRKGYCHLMRTVSVRARGHVSAWKSHWQIGKRENGRPSLRRTW